jgi:hypothetical protein
MTVGRLHRLTKLGTPSSGRQPLVLEGGAQRQIAGAPHYAAAYQKIVRATPKERARHHFVARVVTDPTNPYDSGAVAIYYGKLKVGHLRSADAVKWQPTLAAVETQGREVHTGPTVVAGFHGGTWAGFVLLPLPAVVLAHLEDDRGQN